MLKGKGRLNTRNSYRKLMRSSLCGYKSLAYGHKETPLFCWFPEAIVGKMGFDFGFLSKDLCFSTGMVFSWFCRNKFIAQSNLKQKSS
ncbi:hypothetical protein DsansV1_C02g0015431 [Dioscorea sansibarensis]